MLTIFTQPENLYDMLLTLKSMVMETCMGCEKFFNQITFFAYEKSMIFIFFLFALTGAPFSERGNMVDVFL